MSAILEYAIELGLSMLPVFPCRNAPGAKADKTPLTKNGFKNASIDPDAIIAMFSPHPDCLIGVPTGAPSGIDVLDVDPRHNGHVWYADHKEKLPATRIHRTRSGGLHRLFRHMDGLRNTAAKIAPGIDTRSEGGYFIWWPAIGLEFQDYPPAGLPEWPLWLLPSMMSKPVAPPPPYARNGRFLTSSLPAFSGILRRVTEAREGERNGLTFWAACKCREMIADGAIGRDEAGALLVEAAARTGLPAREATRTILSGLQGRRP